MSCLLKRAMHVSRSACQKLKVRPRSVFDSTSAEVIIDKVVVEQRVIRPKARALFPWRESSLPSDSLANRLYNLASIVSVSFATFGTTIFGTLARSRDFIPGGATAFRCATDSIFYHELMQKHRQQVKMLTTGVEFADAKDVAGLSDIFGDELQAFYRHAIEQHCLKSTHHCTYSLLGVQGVYVSNKELLVGIPRARNEQYVKVGLMWPGQHAIVPTKFRNVNPSKLPPEERKAFDLEVKRCINTKESTVRVWLDVECTEVFAIRDVATGDIVQGSMEPRQVTHQILVENVHVCIKDEKRYTKEWTITDIDNWVEGNQFWVTDKLYPPSP